MTTMESIRRVAGTVVGAPFTRRARRDVFYCVTGAITGVAGFILVTVMLVTALPISASVFGTVVGLFIPAVLQSGFVIIGVQPFWQGVAVGTVLIAAVYVDQSRRAAALRGTRSRNFFKRIKSQRKERQ